MRTNHVLIVISALCAIVECDGTHRVVRTLPYDLSPSRWFSTLRTLWSGGSSGGGGFWQFPRNSAETLLRLIASPDTKKKIVFEFKPEDGPRASYDYQRRYGYRGQWLIESLGSGFRPNGVPYYRHTSVPPSVLVPPPYYPI
ncbi:uncharacterized protein LOC108626595 [Ceratina calcarata]|uniref:Uncharacterized protein LOC108626595 n=1 Tax=Ceratina calcarata TaxID=156304 RepID=A0AAJ7N8Y9_9HYME|nr:uncharacterized protein LOC108626595 [Ceratina calcarata]